MTKSNFLPRAAAAALRGPCLLAIGALLLTPPTALAGASAPKSSSENLPLNLGSSTSGTHAPSSGGASIVRTIVGLAIVIAVIWGLSWILRQVKNGRDPQVSSAGLSSIAALTLSTGRSVHLVRAGSEYVLLGSAEHGVMPIHRYSEEEARAAGLVPAAEAPSSRRRGSSLLGPLLAPPGDAGPEEPMRREPTVAPRHDPMRMSPRGPEVGSGLVGRLREWTVRH